MGTGFTIVGLGVTAQGRNLGVPARALRREALELALDDAGLTRKDVDGYIGTSNELFEDVRHLGLSPGFIWTLNAGGATATASLLTAMGAIRGGQAEIVACVYGSTPSTPRIRPPKGNKDESSTGPRAGSARGPGGYGAFGYGYPMLYGMVGAAAAHAFHARRHMHRYGTTSEHLGAVAVSQRAYAALRPGTLGFGKPITLEDHQTSPMIVDPFRRLDCCRDTDGGVVALVTTEERARDLRGSSVHILGVGTGHNLRNWWTGEVYDRHDDIEPAAKTAFGQAGLTVEDVDVACLYDPFTISPIMQLEAYGFCGPGQGGPFIAAGETGLHGKIPTNTGGGQLSGYYATGFTAVVEAALQLRGEGGASQVAGAEVALVSGHGGNAGIQNTWSHATLLLGKHR
jgi:acetyl-CoA acetyltransferase